MSGKAVGWAIRQVCPRPNTKFVLVALAAHANRNGLAWPSHATLREETGLHRKAIIRELKTLAHTNLIEDTGERRGGTGCVKVWQLAVGQEVLTFPKIKRGKGVRAGTISDRHNSPSFGTLSARRNSPSRETVSTLPNSPSRETVPLGATNSPSGGTWNHKGTESNTDVLDTRTRGKFESPSGVPEQVWSDFLKSPKRRKAGMSPTAYAGICNNLTKLAEHGFPPGDMIALAVENGWTTVKLDWVQNDNRTNKGNRQSPDGLSSTARAALAVFGGGDGVS